MTCESESLKAFLEMMSCEKGAAQNTLQAYQSDLQDWFSFLNKRLPSQKEIEVYISHLYAHHKGARTVARRLSTLRLFYLFLGKIGHMSPLHGILSPRYSTPLPLTLTLEEVVRLLKTAKDDTTPEGLRLWTLLEMLYATGMRISELLVLRVTGFSCVTSETPFLITGKGGHDRYVFLTQTALDALRAYLDIRSFFIRKTSKTSSDALFPSSSKQGILTRQRVGQLMKDLAKKADLPSEKVTPHAIRHAFATHLLEAGMDLIMLQTLLGHQDISTTQIYTHVSKEHLKNTLMRCHPLASLNL